MKRRKIKITADDFGLSPGINLSVIELYQTSALTRASLFANCNYTGHAVDLIKNSACDLPVGIHLSLTCGKCCAEPETIPLLANPDSTFRMSYFSLLIKTFLPFRRTEILRQIKIEFEAQIKHLLELNISINHIDGHRHVHMIPGIFRIASELAAQYRISELRVVNEDYSVTKKIINQKLKIQPAEYLKFLLLKLFFIMNRSDKDAYFFSILFTCRIVPGLINYHMMNDLTEQYSNIEIMLHPGNPDIDQLHIEELNRDELDQILSPLRKMEYNTALEIKGNILS